MANSLAQSDEKNAVQLEVVEGRKIPKGLADIKALIGDTKRTPGYLFDAVLTEQQRKIVCFAAGLKQRHIKMSFYKFDFQERKAVHKAILNLQSIVATFDDANVLMPEKFERTQPKFDVVPHLVAEQQTNTQTH
ncbi:hypothetical protein [Pseudoalteromonas sp. CnMc7-37]|uniref:hypothetical protein n=1 Tax=Pseudoalteromonas sp. CnMc7-37 TaxID=2954496 RepID=UPI002097B698|nr:hypothetical protein [Pseudoalteromonas sp. CnMc7-37]MCO7206583.1 hypothetical protein [Pseudoalteromonas sp. CnMc7-37]